jgi:hypothetical protein
MYFTFLTLFHIILDTDIWTLSYDTDLPSTETCESIDTVALGETVSETPVQGTNIKEHLDI